MTDAAALIARLRDYSPENRQHIVHEAADRIAGGDRNQTLANVRTMRAELAAARKDAPFGVILMHYIDRLTDYDASDPVDAIIKELDLAVHAEIMRQRTAIAQEPKP